MSTYFRVTSEVFNQDEQSANLSLGGPDVPMVFGDRHRGYFSFPIGTSKRLISVGFDIRTAPELVDQVFFAAYAICYRYDEGTGVMDPVGSFSIQQPTRVTSEWTNHLISAEDVDNVTATHWGLSLQFVNDDGPYALTIGSNSYLDITNIYVPDNGLPLDGQPYLDGNQPYGEWEGEESNSTSIFAETST